MRTRHLLLLLFGILLALVNCTTASPRPVADIGVCAADPLTAARAFGVYDARIAKILAPAGDSIRSAGKNAIATQGFDVSRASYGYRAADNTAVALRMPADAAGAFLVGAGSDPRFQIAFAPASGAIASARAELRDGVIVYRDGYLDTDVIASAGRGAAELLYLLKSDAAPKSYAWKTQLPAGVAKVESRNDGLWFLDSKGELVLHVPEPYAIDANGLRRTALLEYNTGISELRVTLTSDVGLTYPILLDPAFETEVWIELQSPPAAYGQAIYDEARKRVVMFGGGIPQSDT
jgi:hypothetical protein